MTKFVKISVGEYVRVLTADGEVVVGRVAWSKPRAFRIERRGRIYRVDRGDVVEWVGERPGLFKRIVSRLKFWG